MKKFSVVLFLLLLLLNGCKSKTLAPAPSIHILKNPIIEVNQEDFMMEHLFSYFEVIDHEGKKISNDQIEFLTEINLGLIGKQSIKFKVTNNLGIVTKMTLNIETVDLSAPLIQSLNTPVFYNLNKMDFQIKNVGIRLRDNFNREDTLIKNSYYDNSKVNFDLNGIYSVLYTTHDSSNNTVSLLMHVEITDSLDRYAQYLYQKTIAIYELSPYFFQVIEQDDELELVNYESIMNLTFSDPGRNEFETQLGIPKTQSKAIHLNKTDLSWPQTLTDQKPKYDILLTAVDLPKEYNKNNGSKYQGYQVSVWYLDQKNQPIQDQGGLFVLKQEGISWLVDSFHYPSSL